LKSEIFFTRRVCSHFCRSLQKRHSNSFSTFFT